jgi:hypothetical protein
LVPYRVLMAPAWMHQAVTMGFRSCRAINCAGLHTKHINNFACLQLVVYYIVIVAHGTR